ncbi:MAG: carboxypeptidase-like regulatory domain-containing protein [Candidatus Methylomirabilales bacterium]
MTRRAASIAVAIFSILFIAPLAWGVVGNIEVVVTDPTGKPIPGATVEVTSLEDPEITKEATTDERGRVVIPVEAGDYHVHVSDPDYVQTQEEVSVGGGETTSTDFSLDPIFPWMVQNPGGCLGCFTFGPAFVGESVDDLDITVSKDVTIDQLDGVIFGPTVARGDTDQLNRDFDHELEVNGGVADFSMGLPKFYIGGWGFYPALNLEVGGADVEFEFQNKVNPANSTTFDGSGAKVGAGVGVVGTLCRACPWYLGFGYKYRMLDASLTRSPSLTAVGGVVERDDVEFSSHSHSAYGKFGVSLFNNRIAPYAGVRGTWYRAKLEGDIRSSFSSGVTQNITFRNEFERDTAEGIFGVDARLWGPLFFRGEGSTNGTDFSLLFKLTYGFGFVDP